MFYICVPNKCWLTMCPVCSGVWIWLTVWLFLPRQVIEMCQQMKSHMYAVYEGNSDDMQVKLQELAEVLDSCTKLNQELQEANQALAGLREDLVPNQSSNQWQTGYQLANLFWISYLVIVTLEIKWLTLGPNLCVVIVILGCLLSLFVMLNYWFCFQLMFWEKKVHVFYLILSFVKNISNKQVQSRFFYSSVYIGLYYYYCIYSRFITQIFTW